MNKRNDSVVRATSYLLIYLTAIQPLHPAMAAGITPDNNQTQVQNQGNVPVVNIATPNDMGISHNTYKEFNVATQGAVLNNATQAAQSQLAGQLNANPNLKEKPAELIINEVTGSGRSDLQGQLEMVGNKANVMIANPNGITCDGCGFINTSGTTLTTGKPQFDKQGALEALEVKQGQITIGDKGLDGKATDYVDILSRATELNGKIQANTLSLTQGANRINLKDGTVKPVAGEGAKPQLAVDTKALGGMYANKIRLVATEDGVGVNLTNLTTAQDAIRLTAEGKIILGEIQAKTDLHINSKAIETIAKSHVQVGQHLMLTTDTLHNQGQIRAGGDITLKAAKLDNVNATRQSHPIITAGKSSRITADEINNVGELSAAQNLTLTGKNFSAEAIKDHQGNIFGKLSAGGDLTAVFKEGFSFNFDKEHFKAGKKSTDLALITGKNIALTAGDLVSRASMRAEQNLIVDAETIYLGQGNLKAGNHVMLDGKSHLDVNGYDISGRDVTLLASRGPLFVVSGDDYTSEGIRALTTLSADNLLRIIADGHINIVDTLINRAKNIFVASNEWIDINQRLAADENINLHAGGGINLKGISLTAGKDITLTSGDSLDVGNVTAGNHLTLIAGSKMTETTLSAEGTTVVAQNSAALHLAGGKYTPVTSALIDLALGHAPQLTLNIPDIAGGLPGIQLADKRARIAVRNNLPILHIAAPNSRGVSHNRYQAFNVGASGLVFNNATEATQSVLAGPIGANPHFNGQSAELIIHEVVGTVASNLQGLLEVVGQKARVFIANPNGMTCNGCGFVNTSAVTLSTGKPVFDKAGALAALDVKKGTITFDKKGLDATAQDDVDIISRAALFNGKVRAKNLTLAQGPNRIDVKRGTLVPITGEGDTPWKAIDVQPSGGMSAGKLRLLSTEPGKAVNLTHLTATQGDIRLTVDGEITLGNIQAKTDITVSSQGIKTAEQSQVQAGKDITLAANTLNNMAKIIADGNIRLFIDRLYNQNRGLIQASHHLWVQKDASGHLSTGIDNTSATLKTHNGDIIIRTQTLNNAWKANVAAGMNAYINATTLDNSQSQFHAKKNLILTGHDFNNGMDGKLSAALNVVADFIHQFSGSALISAKNILLHAGDITGMGHLKAENDLSVIGECQIDVNNSKLAAKKNLTLMAGKEIDAFQAELKGENVELLVREGDIQLGWRQFEASLPTISADNHLRISAGRDLDLAGIQLAKSRHLTFSAGRHLNAYQSQLNAAGHIHLFAGQDLVLQRARINAGQQVTLSAGHDIDMSRPNTQQASDSLFYLSELGTQITAGDDLQLSAGGDIVGKIARLTSTQGNVSVNAGRDFIFSAQKYSPVNDGDKHYLYATGAINAAQNLTLAAAGNLLTSSTRLTSGRDMRLSAGGNVRFESLQEFIREGNIGRFTQHASRLKSGGALTLHAQGSILFQATELMAKGVIDIAATGGFLYAQAMEETYKSEETRKSCKGLGSIKSCKVFGSKTEHKTQIKNTNKVTELTAGGDITLMAKDDVTLEASRLDTQKNAKITSQTGKVNFRAMPNTDVEQTITTSKGFFITHHDKGHSETTWAIPSVQVGGTLTVEAAAGISADVKVKDGQLLEDTLVRLGNTPGTEWLKNLRDRNDVQWDLVKDAYRSWDKKSESLNPVAGAVIAIAVAAVTAGSGLAAWAGSGAVGATGATGATASAVYGAAYGGMIGLTSQAAVALVENKGNLTQTLATLAKRDSVNSLVTQIAVGGTLGGLDHTMGWRKLVEGKAVVDPIKAQLPLLSHHNWSQVAQRVAAHSIVSSIIGTAINGGSFTDNLQTALLNNVGNQINAEGARLIGDNREILGVPGKAISHAAVSALAAEIGGGDAKGAAVGALAAELAAITMESRLFEPAYKNETERQIHKLQEALTGNEAKAQTAKFIGALSGALISHTPEGAYSAANSAELVYRNNMTEHMLSQLSVDNQKDILAAEKGDKAAEERVIARRDAAIAVTAVAAGGYALVYGGHILIAGSAEMATAGRVALEGCKTNPALCLNNVGIFVADTVAPEAAVGTGVLAAGTVKVLGNTKEGTKNLAEELSHASKPLLSNVKPDTHAVTRLIENEKLYAGKGTTAQSVQKWSVDPATKAADEAGGVLVNGIYKNNPTAQSITGLLTDSGRIGSKNMNGQFMYIVDPKGNVIIGTRSGERMPHPTLIGGKDPLVLGAGIVEIRAGKIYSIDNASGHYKPGSGSLDAAKDAFGKLPDKYFSKDFQGYKPYDK